MSVYAVSDLHGHLDLYNQIKEFLKPEDIVYCLGDCGDRGPQPWQTIKAVAKNEQFIYLKGNHEDMLVKAATEYLNPDWGWDTHHQRLLYSNGGERTFEQLLEEQFYREWVGYLRDLPTYEIYTNTNGKKIFLCHAGLTWRDKIPSDKDLIWNREHFYDDWKDEEEYIVVHGHTPMIYLARELDDTSTADEAYKYAGGNKYCIDCCTIRTGKAVLLNLDTFESVLFKNYEEIVIKPKD